MKAAIKKILYSNF